ncbi:Peptidyl-prolyl cis-trans isomerase pin4 [Elasticomyces elasticus]|nr:Peptidyl-prolyl cis-trans isomerase pin4 [Elasticomyces elasticus]
MAPKGKGNDKDKSKAKEGGAEKGSKATKATQQINVRHILCEKHGKKEEALAKLNAGGKFDDVAREFSEDKARTGQFTISRACRFRLPDYRHQEEH